MRTKLVLALLLVLLPAEVGGLVAVSLADERVRSQVEQTLEVTVRLEAERINVKLEEAAGHVTFVTLAQGLPQALMENDSGRADDTIDLVVHGADSFGLSVEALSLHRLDGSVLSGTERIPGAAELALGAVEQGEVVFGRARRVADGDDRLALAAPVVEMEGGPILGALVAEVDLSPIVAATARHNRIGETTEADLAQQLPNGDAEFLLPLRFKEDAAFTTPIPAAGVDAPIQRAFDSPTPTLVEGDDYKGDPSLGAATRIPRTGWGLVLQLDKDEALASVIDMRRLLLVTIGVAGVVIVVIGWVLIRSFSGRLGRITRVAQQVAAGDLTRRIRDPKRDEIGQLALAFDRMTGTLSEDIDRRRAAQEELSFQALHDPLTGLPNRTKFLQYVDECLAGGQRVAVLFCDLDGFKEVNDEYGHNVGDRVLRLAARRLQNAVGELGLLARFGGDEFTLAVTEPQYLEDLDALARQLRSSLDTLISFGRHRIALGLSIGVAVAGRGETADLLIREADVAMYRAKARGRGEIVHASDVDLRHGSSHLAEGVDLSGAIARRELVLHYQPIVDMGDGGVMGVEALLRWNHPTEGMLQPADVLPQLKAAGLMSILDAWVLHEACQQLARWIDDAVVPMGFTMAVNVTTPLVGDAASRENVMRAVRDAGIDPGVLVLEITEEALLGEPDAVTSGLLELEAAGVRLAIDDFGTRYSNLDRVRYFPVDTLKVDRSFVRDLAGDRAITAGIVAIARALGLRVIAEGVETEAQEQILMDLGCSLGQGHRYSPPVPADELARMTRSQIPAL